jgi:hypothetical protein
VALYDPALNAYFPDNPSFFVTSGLIADWIGKVKLPSFIKLPTFAVFGETISCVVSFSLSITEKVPSCGPPAVSKPTQTPLPSWQLKTPHAARNHRVTGIIAFAALIAASEIKDNVNSVIFFHLIPLCLIQTMQAKTLVLVI